MTDAASLSLTVKIETQKLHVGDAVCRLADVYDNSSRMLHGVVIKCYRDDASRFGPYPELYAVRWDDGREQRGFLPHGLDPDVENSR